MPGLNERALDKARSIPADSLILDLEDSVAPEGKAAARASVCAAVKAGGYGRRELVIRPNAIETIWGMDDLRAAVSVGPDAILVPKVSQPGDILTVAKVLADIGAPAKTRLWAMMETPRSILNVREIAALGADPESRLSCLVMGTNDLLKESRARALHNRIAVVPWLAISLVAARAFGLDILDGVYNDFRDEAGFCAEFEHGRILGMDGKTLIHPSQVGPCNEIFSPTEEEISWAHKIIAAFEQPEYAHKGVITVEGKMVERLHLVQAKRTVAIANSIAAMRKVEEPWF
jgi:citrate lyase subunit beta/citryl-CoA lyase